MFSKLTVNMMVDDVNRTVDFYSDVLGFSFVMAVPADASEVMMGNDPARKLVYAVMRHGPVEIMFQERLSLWQDVPVFQGMEPGASVSFYCEVDDIDGLYERLKNRATVIKGLNTTWYGMREFYITDCNGYVLCFASREQ